jgi:LmbE family N-acetylglucosaminyl deacetylase
MEMAADILYTRRTTDGLLKALRAADVFDDWRGAEERWLFVSPHDDDVAIGAGLTFQAGLAEGANVYVAVVTDGRMGYCRPEHRDTIAGIRHAEAEQSYRILGLPTDRLRWFGYPDGDLVANSGRRFAQSNTSTAIEQADGLQNAFTHALRQIRPNRVFLPTSADLHPDHKIVHADLLISLFHAQGAIWPELGEPIAAVPMVYEFACYCDLPEPPQIRIETPPRMLDTKLRAIEAYASQEQIDAVLAGQRKSGPVEYLRELEFHFYRPEQYHARFMGE